MTDFAEWWWLLLFVGVWTSIPVSVAGEVYTAARVNLYRANQLVLKTNIADSGDVSAIELLDVATSRIIGRVTGGSGDSEELTASQVLTLLGVEAGATADQSAAEILTAIKTVDGAGSGLDADLLDGNEAAFFQEALSIVSPVSKANVSSALAATTWTSWTTLDLGATCPAGASAALLLVSLTDDAGSVVGIRKGGSSDEGFHYDRAHSTMDDAGGNMSAHFCICPVDANGDIDYRYGNANAGPQTAGVEIWCLGYVP